MPIQRIHGVVWLHSICPNWRIGQEQSLPPASSAVDPHTDSVMCLAIANGMARCQAHRHISIGCASFVRIFCGYEPLRSATSGAHRSALNKPCPNKATAINTVQLDGHNELFVSCGIHMWKDQICMSGVVNSHTCHLAGCTALAVAIANGQALSVMGSWLFSFLFPIGLSRRTAQTNVRISSTVIGLAHSNR